MDNLSFTTSINIIRDTDKNIQYIETDNAKNVFQTILDNYLKSQRVFYIIGNYGTGKSSFLWALEQTLNKKKKYFGLLNKKISLKNHFEYLPIVGEYSSLIEYFAEILGIHYDKNVKIKHILFKLENKLKELKKLNRGLLIQIDEFGKFLEYAAQNNPYQEIYFIQQLSELICNNNYDALLITTLHQDWDSYAVELTKTQRDDWNKIKGRMLEIPFNEQIEVLLLLAAEKIKVNNYKYIEKSDFHSLLKACLELKAFALSKTNEKQIANKLIPLDLLSASVLTLALQKYGQNERSLFTFIESEDKNSIKHFDTSKNPLYNISCVYDYLLNYLYSYLISKDNKDYTQWSAIKIALERVEGIIEIDYLDSSKIIKTIGLLNIFASKSAKINREFLEVYCRISLGIKDPILLIKILEEKKIIRYLEYASKFILFEGTDVDIELVIREAANKIETVNNVVPFLNKYFDQEIPAKAIYYEKGTPRIFKFVLSENLLENIEPENEIDGIINLIFSDRISIDDVKNKSSLCDEAILFGYFKNLDELRNILFEINKINKAKEENIDDRVATREFNLLRDYYISKLNAYVIESIYSENSNMEWFYKGISKNEEIYDRKSFNKLLSNICKEIYNKTIIFHNELVNRTKLSSSINTAKKNYFNHLINNYSESHLGFANDTYPPEKTIYLTLLKDTGIHNFSDNDYGFKEPDEATFKELWKGSCEFLNSAKYSQKSLKEFYLQLLKKPFKLKKAFIDFWIPTFLFIRREDYAIYEEENFIPEFNYEVIELMVRYPQKYYIKSFDIDGVKLDIFNKYRQLISLDNRSSLTKTSFVQSIKPFLVFYKQLNEYSKNTKRVSNTTVSFREVIKKAKDPEKVFFEEFPEALGYDLEKLRDNNLLIEGYYNDLKNSIRELRGCFSDLVTRIMEKISLDNFEEKLEFKDLKANLINRYIAINEYLLLPYQKRFLMRLRSESENEISWISSLTHALLNKHLDDIIDEEENIIHHKFSNIFKELDCLCDISKIDFNAKEEEIAQIELNYLGESINKYIIRYPKTKENKVKEITKKLKNQLSDNNNLNQAAILRLLKEENE